jgi:3-oxoacyl-[acyl-carrier-protein] synthase-3
MGTRIEAAATAHPRRRLVGRSALYLSDAAANRCLRRGHHRAVELDLLINAGLYKDGNAAEPAFAALIQDDIGANRGSPPRFGHHGTFSFDVLNGGCGVVTAAQLIDALVGHGSARLGLVVAGDADPSPRTSRRFPFSPAGGAILISHTDSSSGFQRFALRTFPEHAPLFEAQLHWDPRAGLLRRGCNVLEVHEAPGFATCCVDRAAEVATEFLADAALTAADIDLVIASQYPRGFGTHVARRLGIPTTRLPQVPDELADSHTAGPIAALEAAITSGRFAQARHTLFITAGAGLTIGLALYRA